MKRDKTMSKRTKTILLIIALIITYAIVLYLLDINCIFHTLTGHPCLTCGVTRSMIKLIHLDIRASFLYFPMLIPLLISLSLILYSVIRKSKLKRSSIIFISTTIILMIVVYILRLTVLSDFFVKL